MTSTHTTTDLNDLLTALEERIQRAARIIQRLRAENARLVCDVESAEARAADWQQRCATWERERSALQARLERLLDDVESLTTDPDDTGTESFHDPSHRDG